MANVCATCHLDFGSVAAFDAHRVGKHAYLYREGLAMEPTRYDGRRCLELDEMEAAVTPAGKSLFGKNSRGSWSLTASINSTFGVVSVDPLSEQDADDGDLLTA